MRRYITAALYLASIVAANYAIQHIGNAPVFPGAPHTLPVWPGIEAPSGVYFVGVTLVLRDVVQKQSGKLLTFVLILAAAALTLFISPALALASAGAFLCSELVDFALFTVVERWSYAAAILCSNAVSIVVDSVLFLTLAGFGLAFLDGQVIGKVIGTLIGFAVLMLLEARRRVVTA